MNIWEFIIRELANNIKVMLIVVIDVNGSSPGKVGFKMAVSETGLMNGSIGGGVMEYNMVELAKKELRNGSINSFIKQQVHKPESEDKSGLICSGEQTHAFIPLDNSKLDIITQINHCIETGEKGLLAISYSGISFTQSIQSENNFVCEIISKENWKYSEQIGLKNTIYIFGGGHVSLPLSQVCRILGFKVVVFDDRKDLTTLDDNQFAHQKQRVDYKDISNLVPESNESFAVIMTVGHKADALVLKQLVTKNLKYLGMIGSKSKVKSIYENLLNDGINEEDLKKVDSPIGLSINSQTTAEIAISIAAKMVQVKNS